MTLNEALEFIRQHGMPSHEDAISPNSELSNRRMLAGSIIVNAVTSVNNIRYILWGDPATGQASDKDKMWDPETIEMVAETLMDNDLGPDL